VSDWVLQYTGFIAEQERLRETLCAVGNGHFVTRGAAPESAAGEAHYPGTYIAGVYNRLVTDIDGQQVENESLVNAPNWLCLRFRAEGGAWFGDEGTEVVEHHLDLDMKRGVLTRRSRLADAEGRIVSVTQRRFVSMADPHLAGLETTVVPVNWSGRLDVVSALDGRVRNDGVARYRDLDSVHLRPLRGDQHDEVMTLVVETTQSAIRIAESARTHVVVNGAPTLVPPVAHAEPGYVATSYELDVREGDEVTIEKLVALFTSRDQAISEPGADAEETARNLQGDFDQLVARHVLVWQHLWHRVQIDVGADHDLSRYIHLHLFHLLQTVSNNTVFNDVGVPARGLHGEAYRGHIFWDELFVLPFLSLRLPQLARSLLLYRYRRMDQARLAARCSYGDGAPAGAMFPWQSASNGREETQTLHLNPKSGRWLQDASHLQRHVSAAVAFNVWQFYEATGDVDFMRFYGAEMMLEIARFWATIAEYNHAEDRYEIKGVMGPDEYHDRYPGAVTPGLNNNAYTNIMAVWCLCRAFDVLETLPPVWVAELRERLVITEQELQLWRDVSHKMKVCFHDGVISQFEGFDELEDLDWTGYIERYGNIQRLDRILEAEGDSPNRYKVTKQPDVMMIFFLLTDREIASLFERLGYEFDDELVERNTRYYEARTAHGSTLSRVVEAWVDTSIDRERSWKLFVEALLSDVDDIQGGTTEEGIHLGAMAGTIDLLQRCYPGLATHDGVLHLDPEVPDELGSLAFDLLYRGHVLHLEFTRDLVRARVDLEEGEPITICIVGQHSQLNPGELLEVRLDRDGGRAGKDHLHTE
jgi:trehalose/maltose hydrolase-like predicted phosphorylase